VEPLAEQFSQITLHVPQIPIVSSVTGLPLTDAQATDPRYWARHLCETVRFTDALAYLSQHSQHLLIEVGPGQTLATLARQHPARSSEHSVFATLPHAKQTISAHEHFLLTLGRLWQHGVELDWKSVDCRQTRFRLHLPTYPFEGQRYWFDDLFKADPDTLPTLTSVPANLEASDTMMSSGVGSCPVVTNNIAPEFPVDVQSQPLPGSASAGLAPDELVRRVIAQQLRLMKQQLEAWQK
jgi:acyl transferase domain-containing protein